MIKTEDIATDSHKNIMTELHHMDLDTQTRMISISSFLQKHPEIVGISYPSTELLIGEKDLKVQNAALKHIAAEIKRRKDIDAEGFRLIYRELTENQVRKILHSERIKENPSIKVPKPKSTEIILDCPFCKKSIEYKKSVRNNVISFRATEAVDDTLTQLAKVFNVSRSYLVQELLKVDRRYGRSL